MRRIWLRGLVGGTGVLALTGTSTLLMASPAVAAIDNNSNASAMASALAGPGTDVVGAGFESLPGAAANGFGDSALSNFPTNGSTFTILTSGNAASADDPNSEGDKTTDLSGGNVRGNTDFDVSVFKVDLQVPETANCLSFDFQFYSEEYPEWVGSPFNDAFIAELDNSNWTTAGSEISAPNNFAFDADNDVVSVNAVGLGGFSAENAAGTTYDGATPLLSAAKQVTPGAHTLYLSIFDQGDRILDSATFVDNLRTGFVPDPETQCRSGAQPKTYQLDLSPAEATMDTGTDHTVTATLGEIGAESPAVPDAPILFQTSGAHAVSGSDTTDAAGKATFTYTGTTVGVDSISACYDIDGNGACGANEPFASAKATWKNTPPENDPGGPYSGAEGSAIALDATASDVNGDPLTHKWTYEPVSGVDAGAACAFGDDSALKTTVTCTDDGEYRLKLTTDDGVNSPVFNTADLTVTNAAPSIGGVSTPVDPVAVGTPVSLEADYTDPGANDTHTASVDWGDGSTSDPTATGGEVDGSHTYTAAGIYTICLTVTDDDGASDKKCSPNYVVVYDPTAGFVTGGGWIDVPEGSYPADPSVSGPGRFGFVSKYQKGATTPNGQTQFQFKAGSMNFHSTSYDWLVVSGSKAIYKGTGTINGEGGYRFLVSVVDADKNGGSDTYRIKIWDTDSDIVVFDNQPGATDDAAATTAISQGSIVIHS
ncbi:choice-of-anchor L domain-containing protein [Streptomyces macrosporus]|uniref:PKD domain-containing protein n=1 Tax=Streptomyces macrosporus TaxID=44032 RepID=A0ABN3KHR3_9ACTN